MTLRIDFGRLFPGVLIFLLGVLFFCIWLVLVFVSFFAFFVPALHPVFFLALDILVASLVLMGCGGALMLLGVSGWRQFSAREGWMDGHAASRADKDAMTPNERGGQVGSLIISFLVILFFIENQVRNTGLFTAAFTPTEQVLFYGTWVVGAIGTLARAAVGRRNAVRPLDAITGALVMVTAAWFLTSWPFNFHHLPDLVPVPLRFLVSWVSNPIAKAFTVIAALSGFVLMVYNLVVYGVVRARQHFNRPWTGRI